MCGGRTRPSTSVGFNDAARERLPPSCGHKRTGMHNRWTDFQTALSLRSLLPSALERIQFWSWGGGYGRGRLVEHASCVACVRERLRDGQVTSHGDLKTAIPINDAAISLLPALSSLLPRRPNSKRISASRTLGDTQGAIHKGRLQNFRIF